MSGGFTVNGTSGSNINWETDGGGDIGDSDATNRPGSIFVKTEPYHFLRLVNRLKPRA